MKEKENNKIKLENTETLTFMDGVIVTWKIFDNILKTRLSDEKGLPIKDSLGYSYLGIITDDITDQIDNHVLYNYFRNHGSQLIKQFGINA